jgi:hypothetical protein
MALRGEAEAALACMHAVCEAVAEFEALTALKREGAGSALFNAAGDGVFLRQTLGNLREYLREVCAELRSAMAATNTRREAHAQL